MELKYRKAIANGVLSNDAMQKLKIQNMSTNPGGALNFTGGLEPKLTTSASGLGSLGSGGTGSLAEKDLTKFFGLDGTSEVAKSGGVGTFLKNNAGGIANAAMSALNFASTIGGLSKNTMTADEMMGSGGQVENNANGISYQESRVDANGIQDQINAQASAATMTGATSGASLGGSIGSLFGPLGTGIGTVAGGILGGVAGLFGGKSAKREAERLKEIAINRTNAMNALNRETAYTIGLRNEFNRENKTGINQSLFHAKDGTENYELNPFNGETLDWYKINTSYGPMLGPANAQTKREERILSNDGWSYKVKNGKHDDGLTYLKPGDTVISAEDYMINPSTGNKIIDDADAIAKANGGFIGRKDKNWLEMNLNIARMMVLVGKRKPKDNSGYIGGTLDRFSTGGEDYGMPLTQRWNRDAANLAGIFSGARSPYFTANTTPQTHEVDGGMLPEVTITPTPAQPTTETKTNPFKSAVKGIGKGFGALGTALSGLDFGNILTTANAFANAAQRDAKAEGIRAPKSYMANPYENMAIDELNKLQSDYYQVWAGNREAEGRAKSAIALSGGVGAGQRMLAYMGLLNQTQQNNAKAMFDALNINNELRAQAAKIKLATGENSANRMQQAYHWDEDMLAKAHAAQLNMWEQSAFDRQNAIESFFHNRFKKQQFDRTMNLYESQQKNDDAKTKAIIDGMKNNTNNPASSSTINTTTYTNKYRLPSFSFATNPFFANGILPNDGTFNNIVAGDKAPVKKPRAKTKSRKRGK